MLFPAVVGLEAGFVSGGRLPIRPRNDFPAVDGLGVGFIFDAQLWISRPIFPAGVGLGADCIFEVLEAAASVGVAARCGGEFCSDDFSDKSPSACNFISDTELSTSWMLFPAAG